MKLLPQVEALAEKLDSLLINQRNNYLKSCRIYAKTDPNITELVIEKAFENYEQQTISLAERLLSFNIHPDELTFISDQLNKRVLKILLIDQKNGNTFKVTSHVRGGIHSMPTFKYLL